MTFHDHFNDDRDDLAGCPACGSIGNVLGHLGDVLWLRCRNCGTDYESVDADLARRLQQEDDEA